MTRRQAIKATALTIAATSISGLSHGTVLAQGTPADNSPQGSYVLPPLPYAADALEPHIDAQTMLIHHDKHHAAYVANLNKALATFPDLTKKSAEELVTEITQVPESTRTAVQNNAGGHANHSLFWQLMKKDGGGKPENELGKAIDGKFTSFDSFKEQFSKSTLSVFGSGWAWLVLTPQKTVEIVTTPNQNSPLTNGQKPIFGIDVWEHAYYLKYQNRRVEYVAAWWNVLNWDFIQNRYSALLK